MSVMPQARYRPVKFAASLPPRSPRYRAVIVHTNGGGTDHGSLFNWWNSQYDNTHQRLCSHFQVMWDGTIEQYLSCDLIAWAEYGASHWAVSVETQDDGDPTRPWSGEQLDAIVEICKWVGAPGDSLVETGSDGIGYHSAFPSWNTNMHDCPGTVRQHQLTAVVAPRLGGLVHVPPFPGRVLALSDPEMHGSDVRTWEVQMAHRGWAIRTDGWYDASACATCESFQREKGLKADGRVGPLTWAAAWTVPVT